ncbi:phage terminase large subunit [Rhodocytophaga rosea]|uniref:Phage terminase large subunit n=1 Tax=Rhodocytophaga rosea TaxID=2704465 RepID=A0A6C0GLT2_9BACT|nr:phage terminase large subunit [Rhodocytophaga rosea]QHT68985.1 phage terminase large subunit [Rhodocytophaga rosea]
MISLEKSQLLDRIQQMRKAQLEESFYEFVKDAFEVLHPGQQILDNWHIKYICELLQVEVERIVRGEKRSKHLIINVPPRSLKSFITSICLPAWAFIKDARLKFIGSSYSNDLSVEHNKMSRRIIESDWYQQYWKDKVQLTGDQNQKEKFETTQHGMRRATSTGAGIMGAGANIVIVDDPLNPMLATSEKERKTANLYFDQSLTTRLNNPDIDIIIVIMQRLHEEDLTGHLLKKNPDRYEHICIPAELSTEVKPLELTQYYRNKLFFPQRFSSSTLAEYKIALGSYGYAGQFSQRPAPDEGGVIKKAWFKSIRREAFRSLAGSAKIDFFIDTAYTEKQTNDPTALLACCYVNNHLYILDSERVWKELPDLLKYIKEFAAKNGYSYSSRILIEPKASGKSTVQSFKNTDFNVVELPPPTDSKLVRVNNITPFLEAGRCTLIDGQWNDSFLGECAGFPTASHDDQVDCLTAAVNHYSGKKPFKGLHGYGSASL